MEASHEYWFDHEKREVDRLDCVALGAARNTRRRRRRPGSVRAKELSLIPDRNLNLDLNLDHDLERNLLPIS